MMKREYRKAVILSVMLILCLSVHAFADSADTSGSEPSAQDSAQAEQAQEAENTEAEETEEAADDEAGISEEEEIAENEAESIEEDTGDDQNVPEPETVTYIVEGKGHVELTDGKFSYKPARGWYLDAVYLKDSSEEGAAGSEELILDQLNEISYEEGAVLVFSFEADEQDSSDDKNPSCEAIYDGVCDENAGAMIPGGGNG